MTRTRSAQVALCFLLLACTFFTTAAYADGWSFPSLNPFGQGKSSSGSFSQSDPVQLPDLTRAYERTQKPKTPTVWQKITNGTKNALVKTKETVFPWTKKPTNQSLFEQYSTNGSNFQRPPAEKKGSFFTNWLKPEDEKPKKPRSVKEFLELPRPR